MAITTERVIGNQINVHLHDDIQVWSTLDATINEKTADASAADSTEDEEVSMRQWIAGKCTGLLGSANNGGTLPDIGDAITLSAKVGADSLLPDLTRFHNIKVVAPITYNFKDGPASFEFNFRSGRMN